MESGLSGIQKQSISNSDKQKAKQAKLCGKETPVRQKITAAEQCHQTTQSKEKPWSEKECGEIPHR
jgi:hypothetical protein